MYRASDVYETFVFVGPPSPFLLWSDATRDHSPSYSARGEPLGISGGQAASRRRRLLHSGLVLEEEQEGEMAGDLTFSGEGSASRNARRIARWRQLAIVCTSLSDPEAVHAGKRCCLPRTPG